MAPDALRDRELEPARGLPFGPTEVGVDTGDGLLAVPAEGVVKRVWLWFEKYPGLPAIKLQSSEWYKPGAGRRSNRENGLLAEI